MARRQARELAFRTLFQASRGQMPLQEVWYQVREDIPLGKAEEDSYDDELDAEGLAFADRLIRAYDAHRDELDAQLEEAIEGWTFSQMAQTDLNVLRLALTEFLYEQGVPKEVTIEMAVRLAKKYGGEESGRFVNGVLAKLYRQTSV